MNHDIQLYQWRIQELDLGGLISSSSSSLLSFNSSSSLSFFSSLSLTKKCWGVLWRLHGIHGGRGAPPPPPDPPLSCTRKFLLKYMYILCENTYSFNPTFHRIQPQRSMWRSFNPTFHHIQPQRSM